LVGVLQVIQTEKANFIQMKDAENREIEAKLNGGRGGGFGRAKREEVDVE